MPQYNNVLITGASRGIGEALALLCAAPGVTLHLSGRDSSRLESVAAQARARGAAVDTRILDVRDRDGMARWIHGAGPLDLVVANAGIAAGTGGGIEPAAQAQEIFSTNLDGALNTAQPAIEAMLTQAPGPDGVRGRIAVLASMAVYMAMPGGPAYAASKTALDTWVQATGINTRRQGVIITSFCPGYVRTAMTADNTYHMPGLMSAEHAAATILRHLPRGRPRVTFPRWMALGAQVVNILPADRVDRLLRALPGRTAQAYVLGPGR
ncbi:SDR family NAD(P)-dependent oxidoreductase [Roseomonas elaeocarpi]|uniref:SDR family NAD(P)-dependent oxidoreductase n=1 Tax=Roseomonas elaeocarpi TaxID=907779 RepID=A0ABV6JUX5_9PROT